MTQSRAEAGVELTEQASGARTGAERDGSHCLLGLGSPLES